MVSAEATFAQKHMAPKVDRRQCHFLRTLLAIFCHFQLKFDGADQHNFGSNLIGAEPRVRFQNSFSEGSNVILILPNGQICQKIVVRQYPHRKFYFTKTSTYLQQPMAMS
jgi:hypothetical protein